MSDPPRVNPPPGKSPTLHAQLSKLVEVVVSVTARDEDGNQTKRIMVCKKEEGAVLRFSIAQHRNLEPGWEEGEVESSFFYDDGHQLMVCVDLERDQPKILRTLPEKED